MFGAVYHSLASGLPNLIVQFFVGFAILAGGMTIYISLTPMREIQLIRANNPAAALATSGAIVAFAIPLAAVIVSSVNVYDVMVYGAVALALQLAADFVAHFILRELPERISRGEISAAIIQVGIKFAVALLNAAAVTV